MNKKFIYSLVLTSIFIMSIAAVCIQPAAGANWKFGVPKEAIGMKLQSEVKAYDKDLWGDCIGLDSDDRASLATGTYREGFSTDGNDVGARSQSEITDWESGDYWFMGDTLLWTKLDESIRLDPAYDRTGDKKSDLQTYWDAIEFAEKTIAGLANRTDTVGTKYNLPLLYAIWGITYQGMLAAQVTANNFTLVNTVQNGAKESTFSKADVTALFHKTYEAKILERDIWYWDAEVDFEDADEEDVETPFIEDPEDLYDSWVYFYAMTEELFGQAEKISDDYFNAILSVGVSSQYAGQLGPYAYHTHGDGTDWDFLNTTIYNTILAYSAVEPYTTLWTYLNAPLAFGGFGGDAWMMGYGVVSSAIEELVDFFRSKVPDRAEYLLMLLKAGIPAHQDVGKWLEKMIDAFSIDEDKYYDAAGDPFMVDISIDGLVITAEIEWATGVSLDESKPWSEDNQREDYEIVFTYGDTGGQSSIEFKSGDDIFYKTEGISPTIVGYEVSILLGAAAIATLGLIFVVIKKRRM